MAGGYSLAQQPEVELAPITVSAHDGTAVPYDSTGISVSVLDVEELRKSGQTHAADAMCSVPGVTALPGGGENQRGNVSKVAIRGINRDTAVLPMLDGMRIFNSGGGGLLTANTMARTDLFSIGTLEVLKGSQGAVYGAGAMGGVVYMETPMGDADKPQLSLFNEGGSHDSYMGNLTAQGKEDDLAYFLSISHTRTDNDIRFADGSRGEHEDAGKATSWTEALRLDWQANENNSLTFTYRREDSTYGYESLYWGSHYYIPYSFRNNLATLKWQSQIDEQWTSSLMVGYYGYDATLGTGYTQELRNLQAEWRNSYQWDEQHTTTAGVAWNHSTYDYLDGFTTTNGDHNREDTYAFFAEHTYAPADNWRNSVAARLELSNIYSASLALRAASSYDVNDATRLFGSVGTGYRSPGSFQRSKGVFTSGYYTYHGNPDLKQEKSISADLGIEHIFAPAHTVSLTGFWQRMKNGIDTTYVGYDVYYTNDSAHWDIMGVELALQGTIEQTCNTGYKVAWTHTRPKTSDGRQIAWTARNTWTAELFTSPMENLTNGVGLAAATGRTNYKDAATSRIDNYYTLRWYAHYKVTDNLTLHLRVENLTDQKFVTEGSFGLPGDAMLSAGTSVHAGFNLTF
ncbi:MAG: TonB-dependent receptor [Akkermansia sp.]|nr:TonB-dependent receptor [Akkermansia sp.]